MSATGSGRGYAKGGDRSIGDEQTPLAQLVEVVVSTSEEVKAIMDFSEFVEISAKNGAAIR